MLPWCLMVRWTGPAHQPVRRVPTSGVEPSESEMMRAPESTKGNQLAEPPYAAAVDRFAAQPALVPGAPELLRIEGIKIIFHIEQAAAEFAGMQVLLGVLAAPAGFLDALEIGGGHGFLKGKV